MLISTRKKRYSSIFRLSTEKLGSLLSFNFRRVGWFLNCPKIHHLYTVQNSFLSILFVSLSYPLVYLKKQKNA